MKRHPERAKAKSGTNLEHAHLLNQRVVLDTVRLHGPVSRVEIARLTALSNQTVFNITDRLWRIRLIQDFGRTTAERGQPAKLFEINPDAAFSIGIHFERDHIAAVLVDFKGAIRARTYRAGYLSTPEEGLKQGLSSIKELQRKNGRRRIWGLGIASPGPMDFRNGKVIYAPNFPGWEQVNIRDYFKEKTGLRVLVDNDATAAAIGESWYGTARALGNFFYIYVGVGVGGGVFVDGRPYRGFRGSSGEVGHLTVNRGKKARPCGCGKKGCLEAYLSLTSLCQRLNEAGIRQTELPHLVGLFEKSNKPLMAWLETAASYLSGVIGNLQLLFDPEAFVVGGHLPRPLLAFLCERCSCSLSDREQPIGLDAPRVLQGSLEDEAAALGAAALPTHDLIAPNYEGIASGDQLSLLELWDLGN
ncbi:MAG: ROK family protein [Chthoniobacterales bacterium]